MERNNKAMEHIKRAYGWLEKIPVTGDGVDCMAMARQELRRLWDILTEPTKADTTGGDANG